MREITRFQIRLSNSGNNSRRDAGALVLSTSGDIPIAILTTVAEGRKPANLPPFIQAWHRDFDYLYVVGPRVPQYRSSRRSWMARCNSSFARFTNPSPSQCTGHIRTLP